VLYVKLIYMNLLHGG